MEDVEQRTTLQKDGYEGEWPLNDIEVEAIGTIMCNDEESLQQRLAAARAAGEFIAYQRWSDTDRENFSRIIREFNALFHMMANQTWGNTLWRGVPLAKAPTDLWIYQELIHAIKPDLIIETGSFRGGSALYMSDIMRLCENHGKVISIDTDMSNLHSQALHSTVKFLKTSSVSDEAITFVKAHIAAYDCQKIMVVLDSDHEKEHVLREIELYAPLVTVGSALIVEDTNNHPGPKEAIDEWYPAQPASYEFRKDFMCEKFMLTFNRDGYLERVK